MEKSEYTVTVKPPLKKEYPVFIGKGALSLIPEFLCEKKYGKVCVVSDERVFPLYFPRLSALIGKECLSFVFGGGEKEKTPETVLDIVRFLSENEFSQTDLLIALGGGVVGDVTGFAASVYLRGIPYLQVPTTLLSAVDSSVGGKTGVNFGGIKNRIGAFYQPEAVFCDTLAFDTLSPEVFASGMAEVIKYSAIRGGEILSGLENGENIEKIIKTCVEIKSDIVSRDEYDKGERHLLNFGHTFAHAIESATENGIDHGHAVALGMAMAFRASESLVLCGREDTEKYLSLAKRYGLETEISLAREELFSAMTADKKREGEFISLVLPVKFGKCVIRKVTLPELHEILEKASLGK